MRPIRYCYDKVFVTKEVASFATSPNDLEAG